MGGSTGPGGGSLPRSGRENQTDGASRPHIRVRLRRRVARLLMRATDTTMRWVMRLLGEDAHADISGAQLRDLVAHSTALNREERRLIDDVLTAGDRHVRELMVPRTEVAFLDTRMTIAEAVRVVQTARHSRFPVIDGTHDDVMGFVHLRDLLLRPVADEARTVGELARELRQLPASKPALAALSEMRRAGDHLALVVDEYGGTAGIVSLEDLIEELVGEIHDEYDAAPEANVVDGVAPSEVEGLLNLNDFAERTGFALAPGPYDTVGGFVMAALGRLPVLGDEVRVGDWHLVVVGMDGRRVARVGLTVASLVSTSPYPIPVAAVPEPVTAS